MEQSLFEAYKIKHRESGHDEKLAANVSWELYFAMCLLTAPTRVPLNIVKYVVQKKFHPHVSFVFPDNDSFSSALYNLRTSRRMSSRTKTELWRYKTQWVNKTKEG
jgi:hypothetical protein